MTSKNPRSILTSKVKKHTASIVLSVLVRLNIMCWLVEIPMQNNMKLPKVLTDPSHFGRIIMVVWLVVSTPLKNMSSSVGMFIPNIRKKMFQTTTRLSSFIVPYMATLPRAVRFGRRYRKSSCS